MKRLKLEFRDKDIFPGAPEYDASGFVLREAARGVVLAQDGSVHLLHMTRHKYHKLPGGGLEESEDPAGAFARECMEEIGCRVEIIAELGEITEYRKEANQKQVSYCFLAKQVGGQTETALDEGEIAEGAEETKAKSIDDAIKMLEQDEPDDYDGHFIKPRDLVILKTAKEALS